MSFHLQSFNARHATMGDIAEGVFDHVYSGRAHELGLNRYWQNGDRLYMNKMTPAMRYAPDRMTIDALIEVMGVGHDQTLKIKLEKLDALTKWEEVGPVRLFVYDSKNHRYWEASLGAWFNECADHGTLQTFPEGKQYWALHTDHFPVEATDVEA